MVPLLLAAFLTPVAAWCARRADIVDHPGPLKVQERPVSYLGGVAVFGALAVPVATWHPMLLLPLGVSAILGLADDVAGLSARARLAFEAANGVIVASVVLPSWQPLSVLFVTFAVVLMVNAVNLIDGLDGLAAGVGAAGAAGFSIAMHGAGRTLALALLGSLVGFLLWNRPPARIYLGDSGSYLIGTALAILLVTSTFRQHPPALAGATVLFIAVPLADAGVAIVRRWRAGAPLLHGDRGHIYDQLVDRGLNRRTAAAACVSTQIVLVIVGLAIAQLPADAATAATSIFILALGISLLLVFTVPPAPES